MFVESLSPSETRQLVEHFVADAPMILVPGPGRHITSLLRGFVVEDEDRTISLNMTETTRISTSRFSNSWLGKHLLGVPSRASYNILVEDLIDATRSRNIVSMSEDHVSTVFLDERLKLEQAVRYPTPDDVAFVNRALATILFGRGESEF